MSETCPVRHPRIIQGGMGIADSDWRHARAVSRLGELGVVSGTANDSVMVRRLQDGDSGGHVRRALAAFPVPHVADDILNRYFLENGRKAGVPYRLLPMYRKHVTQARDCITLVANFVEVWLSKEGHDGVVGINLLAKVQMPTLPSLFGAMLAGVDYVLMGAGIPREIPGALDAMAELRPARLKFDIEGDAPGVSEELTFDPRRFVRDLPIKLRRPFFLPIISAVSLAATLARKANGRVDGFVVEGHTAGGHNAPPRGEARFTEDPVNPSTAIVISWTWQRCMSLGFRSGLRAARAVRRHFVPRSRRAQLACRWEHCSPTARSPG